MTDTPVAIVLYAIVILLAMLAGSCIPLMGVSWRARLVFLLCFVFGALIVNGLRNHCDRSAYYCQEG